MHDTRALALEELKQDALDLGANAVTGVSFAVTSMGQGGSMILLCATGTAVRLAGRG